MHGAKQLFSTTEVIINQNAWNYQEWTQVEAGRLLSVGMRLFKATGATGTLQIYIMAADVNHKPDGVPISYEEFEIEDLVEGTPGDWIKVDMTDHPRLKAGVEYCLVIGASPGSGNSYWRDASGNMYAGGVQGVSADGGSSWAVNATLDFTFDTYYDDGIHRVPVLDDFSWQPPVTEINNDPPA